MPWPSDRPASAPTCVGCGTVFPVRDGIVSIAAVVEEGDYPAALHDVVAHVEARHFWFEARNRIILAAMRRTLGPLEARRLLEVGCGSGYVLAMLEGAGLDVCGVDMHRAALEMARDRIHGPLLCSSATRLPFFDDFDIVGLFDVIEHADNDVGLLRQARTVLRPHGQVVVTVPAGAHLWTAYDQATGHKRRYSRQSLADTLNRGVFHVTYLAAFNCLPLMAQRLYRRFTTPVDVAESSGTEIVRQALRVPPGPLNRLFAWLMRVEAPLRGLPFVRGGSLIAIGETTD